MRLQHPRDFLWSFGTFRVSFCSAGMDRTSFQAHISFIKQCPGACDPDSGYWELQKGPMAHECSY